MNLAKFTKQTCTYWAPGTPDGFGGFTWPAPDELACRWDERITMVRDGNGVERVSNATVLVVDKVDADGMLYLGQLESSGELPDDLEGAQKIITVKTITDSKGRTLGYQAFL